MVSKLKIIFLIIFNYFMRNYNFNISNLSLKNAEYAFLLLSVWIPHLHRSYSGQAHAWPVAITSL